MKCILPNRVRCTLFVLYCAVFIFLLGGCSVKLVADYNAEIAQQIIQTARKVDAFYGVLIETPHEERSYDKFAEKYRAIEVDLRSLVMQNRVRPLNEESAAISSTTLEKWMKYKNKHKSQWERYKLPHGSPDKIKAEEIYKDVLVGNHRQRFHRLFTAMMKSEEAKKLQEGDFDAGGQE